MFIDAFVVFFCPHGSFKRRFLMKLLLAASRLKKKRSWFHYMLWTCSDEHLFLEIFTEYFISFRERQLNFAIPLFSQLEKTKADYKDFSGVVGNETDESAVFRNFTIYFNQLDPPLSLSLSFSLSFSLFLSLSLSFSLSHCAPLTLWSLLII